MATYHLTTAVVGPQVLLNCSQVRQGYPPPNLAGVSTFMVLLAR